ncbi:MAG: AAA domain-containing protein [Desulforhopalus sp.]
MKGPSIRESLQAIPQKSCSSKDPFPYFCELAASLKNEQEGRSYLESQLKKILPVNNSSVLFTYLHDNQLPEPITPDEKQIFPFGCNASQTKAVRKAMSEKLSLIQGPPGTGKTQTILNIIANVILQGKTVAVVSNNNAATANVAEKLAKYGLEFLVAQLGNKNNKTAFFASQPKFYPDFSSAVLDPGEIQKLKGRVVSGNQSMLNSKVGDIIKYVEYNHCEVKESKVYSVFR